MSAAMAIRCTKSSGITVSIISLVLFSVVTSGIPLVKVHSHEGASFGHNHDVHEYFDVHSHDDEIAGHGDDTDLTGTLHAHEVSTPALTLLQVIDTDTIVVWNEPGQTTPSQTRPPDNVITPLHRPPIA